MTSLHQIVTDPLQTNCYVVPIGDNRSCIIVDPGLDPEPINKKITSSGLYPRAILCTHGHFDHVGSAAYFQEKYDVPVYLHHDDLKILRSANFQMMAFKIKNRIKIPQVTLLEGVQQDILICKAKINMHLMPGHTPGSCVFALNKNLFCGDTLYASGIGLSKLPGASRADLINSIKSIKSIFSNEMIAYPGHGHSSPLGEIWDNNIELNKVFLSDT
jgi:hydroxyacylglutathione hydrolase